MLAMNLLKDAEARIRALTREVGSLREDLRRECKRRERAVAQARQNEELRTNADAKVQELEYSNRKLVAELESAKEIVQTSSERDRRAMRSLREGLAAVEKAVATRTQQGNELLRVARGCLERLKLQLIERGPADVEISMLAEAQRVIQQLLDGSSEDADGSDLRHENLAGTRACQQRACCRGEGMQSDVTSSLQGLSSNIEKAELQEQVAHLRSQIIVLKASAEQAASAAALAISAAASRKADSRDAASTNSEVQLSANLQQAMHENNMLRKDLTDLEQRLRHSEQQLQQHEANSAQLKSIIRELQDSGLQAEQHIGQLQDQVLKLQSSSSILQQENSSLVSQLQNKQQELKEQSRRLANMQGAISEQNQDVRTALELISHRESMRGALLHPASTSTLRRPAHGLSNHQRSVSFLPEASAAPSRALSAGPSLNRSAASWMRAAPADYLAQRDSGLEGVSDLGASHQQPGWTNASGLTQQPANKLLPPTAPTARHASSSRDRHVMSGTTFPDAAKGASAAQQALPVPSSSLDYDQSAAPERAAASRDAVAGALAAARAAAAAAEEDTAVRASHSRFGLQRAASPAQAAMAPLQHRAAFQSDKQTASGTANASISAIWPADDLGDDLQDLDQEISQLEVMLKRAAGLTLV